MVRIDTRASRTLLWHSGRRSLRLGSFANAVGIVLTGLLFSIGARNGLGKDEVRANAARDRVHRSRMITSAVAKISDSLEPDCDAEILRLVQLVLDYEPDSFGVEESAVGRNRLPLRPANPVKEGPPLLSAHATVEAKLSKAGPQLLARYETQFAAEANQVLAEAHTNRSIAGLRSVCRRFFLTSAGYAAAEELVFRWLDAGEYDLAAQLATQILSEPAHHDRIRQRFREIAGQLNAVASRMEMGKPPESVAPEPLAFPRHILRNRESMQLFETGWMTFGGNLTRTRVVSGTDPIPIPQWHSEYFPEESRQLVRDYLAEWEAQQKEVDQPCCPAAFPIVARGRVIFRDSTGVKCVSSANGLTEWSFPCQRDLWTEVRQRYDQFTRPRQGNGAQQRRLYHLATNSVMGTIASDGRLVYAIDANPLSSEDDTDSFESFIHPRFYNRLLALQLGATRPQGDVAWINNGIANSDSTMSVGDSSRAESRNGSSKRMSFLGPPLPGPTELLCITEHDDEIHLTALVPASGAVIWSQPLCTLERSERVDVERHDIACVPARSGGIVVCPTGTGLLVAVDQARTRLLWAVYLDEIVERNLSQPRGTNRAPTFSYGGYPAYCQISNGHVVYLSPRGSQLYCLELTTGRILWNTPRSDAEFLGTIADQRVVVVGRQSCRCHSLLDGKPLWTTAIDTSIGCGLAIGNHYLLPLEAGRLALINLQTGRDEGTRILRSDVPLGHLAADGEHVYSLSQRGLVSFPQIHYSLSLLNERNATPQIDKKDELIRAEVALVKNDLPEGERRLKSALGGILLGTDRRQARRELKGILFERVIRGTDVTNADCDRLDQLLESPEEEFRFLTTLAQPNRAIRGRQSRREQIHRVYRLPAHVASAMPEDDQWFVSPAVWCRMQLAEMSPSDLDPRIADLKSDQELISPVLSVQERDDLRRFIRLFDKQPVADAARMRLASALEVEGSPHAAEFLWLRNRASSNPQVAADACQRLIELWTHLGFINDAVRQFEALRTTFAETRLPNGLTGAEYIRGMDHQHPVIQFWRHSREPVWRTTRVDISQSLGKPQHAPLTIRTDTRKKVLGASGQTNRLPAGIQGRPEQIAGQPFGFFVGPGNAIEQQTTVSVTDQRTMVSVGTFASPLDARWPKVDRSYSGAHFFLLGTRGGAVGVSIAQLSEGDPAWFQQPSELAGLRIAAFPGPWGPSFAAFTWRNRIYVVDPLDGALLWQRTLTSVPKESQNNVRLDLVGDGSAIAIQSMDHATYEVFETATGRSLPVVKPSLNMSEVIGRNLYGISESPKGSRLQIRDLLKEVPDIDEPIADKIRKPVELAGGEVAFLSGSELRVYDVVQCQKKFYSKLDDSEVSPFNMAKMLSDDSRYYLNLGRPTSTAPTKLTNQAIADTPIPSMMIKDDLYAFDRTSGELLWKRSIPLRTLLQFPECQVPFLVTISQVKDSMSAAPQSLTIEVIDSKTGTTLGYRENLTLDRLTSAEYDGLSGRIKLTGQSTEIELRFGPDEGQSLRDWVQ